MKVIQNIYQFEPPPDWENSVITLGTFDGFHRGHQALMRRLRQGGKKNPNWPTVLVTYHPNPALIVNPDKFAREIFSRDEKLTLLQNHNPDYVVMIEFTPELARKSAAWFLEEILVRRLRAGLIILGYDHHFGRGREGNYSFLKGQQDRFHYQVQKVGKVQWRGRKVSSTAIRRHLSEGRVDRAASLLGYSYFMEGQVIRGYQRGNKLGFPTANILASENKLLPAIGVYSGAAVVGNQKYTAMINIGRNPTFENTGAVHVEAHLLDFVEDIYGTRVRLYFHKRLRAEKKFNGPEELTRQLRNDRKKVRALKPERMKLLAIDKD